MTRDSRGQRGGIRRQKRGTRGQKREEDSKWRRGRVVKGESHPSGTIQHYVCGLESVTDFGKNLVIALPLLPFFSFFFIFYQFPCFVCVHFLSSYAVIEHIFDPHKASFNVRYKPERKSTQTFLLNAFKLNQSIGTTVSRCICI